MSIDWEAELTRDAEALEEAIKREARRKRMLRALEVEEVQRILESHPRAFARVIQGRKKLVSILAGVGERVGGEGTANYVVRHRQEGHVDEKLVTAYEALWIKTYGSGAGYIGDPNALVPSGAGGNQFKMGGSGERVYRGVAKGGGGSGSRRSIIKDEKAFNFKRKMDKRMRRMASEINEFMISSKVSGIEIVEAGGGVGGRGAPRCAGCKCFVDREWRFCASCGVRCVIA